MARLSELGACRDMGFSYFNNPFELKPQDKFKVPEHKVSTDSSWIHGSHTSYWVQEELRKCRLAKDGEDCVVMEKQTSKTMKIHSKAWQGYPSEDHESFEENKGVVALLTACAKEKDLRKGSQIHAAILTSGLLGKDVFVGTALVNMYAKCGALTKAQEVFDKLVGRNVVSWNALIAAYGQHGRIDEAVNCLERMQDDGLFPNDVTFTCILKACGSAGASKKGEDIHAEVVKRGLLEGNFMLGTALMDMYAKCGALVKAQELFDELSVRDVVSCNALIAGYAQHGHGVEAVKCYKRMQQEGLSPDAVTYTCILKACGSIGAAELGEQIHAEIIGQGLLEMCILLGNSLVDMYAKCDAIAKAHKVFDELPVRDVVSSNVLIAGYAHYGHFDAALECFESMQHEGLSPDAVTFICILKACISGGAVEKGEEIHKEAAKMKLLEKSVMLGNALVDMYAKCGSLAKAREVFDELPVRNVVTWSVLIAGYAQHGLGDEALKCFERMKQEGLIPDVVTFIVLLNACSHSGLVDMGEAYFATMSKGYGIIPTLEHYTCMVDLFGRAGHLDKAVEVIEKMPPSVCHVIWFALLGACRKWGNLKLGRLAFENVVQREEKDAAAYVCINNVYIAASFGEEARLWWVAQNKDDKRLLLD